MATRIARVRSNLALRTGISPGRRSKDEYPDQETRGGHWRKTKRWPECGSRLNVSLTISARPSDPLRISVWPVTSKLTRVSTRDRNHRRVSALDDLGPAPSRRRPPPTMILLAPDKHDLHPNLHRGRSCGGRSRRSLHDPHRHNVQTVLADVIDGPFSPSPGEQHIGVQTITARYLRNGCAGRKALRDDPLLVISRPRPSPARLAAIRAAEPRKV